MQRVVLAMSGGVDSSAAAHLLLAAGYDVVGVFMRHGEESAASCKASDGSDNPLLPILQGRMDHKQGCCSASDAMDARRVADKLSIPFYALDMQSDFRRIVDYFVDEYTHGRTPNPCVQCNNWIKFGRLFDYADSVDAEFVATGHYAQLVTADDGPALIRGVDSNKDQSYALAGIDRAYLKRMLLPVGKFLKPEIRRLAGEAGLKVADKRDSQEICFVSNGKHAEFVRARAGAKTSGDILTTAGVKVGVHQGIEGYTIGQRKGIGVAMKEPYFVVRIDPQTNAVVIGTKDALAESSLIAEGVNWLIDPPTQAFEGFAQIRYNSDPVSARIEPIAAKKFKVHFAAPALGVAPGQLCAVYRDDRVLGCGWISSEK
jgi:tRNA-uridine 2-sulfurtransferase